MIVGTTEAAKILKISTARLRVLLMAGRVEGAYKTGKMWLMPLFNGKPIIKRKVGGVGFRPAKLFKRTRYKRASAPLAESQEAWKNNYSRQLP